MCKNKTFSMQLVINGPNKNQIQVPVFGEHRCSLHSVWFHSPGHNNTVDVIRLNSPQFRLKYSSAVLYLPNGSLNSELSSQPYPVFLTRPDAQIGGLNGSLEWDYNFNGTVELQLENLTGVINADDFCIISINLTPIHD